MCWTVNPERRLRVPLCTLQQQNNIGKRHSQFASEYEQKDMAVPADKKTNPQLHAACTVFLRLALQHNKDIPQIQINALYTAITYYASDIKISKLTVDYFAKYGITAKEGHKMSQVIFLWAKELGNNFTKHPQFVPVYQRLMNELYTKRIKENTKTTPMNIPVNAVKPASETNQPASETDQPKANLGHQAVPRAKIVKPTHSHTTYYRSGYFQGGAKSDGYGGITKRAATKETDDILDAIRAEINKYDTNAGYSGYETPAAKQSVIKIIQLVDELRPRYEEKCKSCNRETTHCVSCAHKPKFSIIDIRDAYLAGKVAISNATDVPNRPISEDTTFKIDIHATYYSNAVFFWHKRGGYHSEWVSIPVMVSSQVLKEWEEAKKKKEEHDICSNCNQPIKGDKYLKTQNFKTVYQCKECALGHKKLPGNKLTTLYG